MSASCNFGTLRDRLLRDRIVVGVKDKTVQDRLLREPKLTLNKACEIARAAEHIQEQSAAINKKKMVHAVQKNRNRYNEEQQNICGKCGRCHNYRECPAYGRECRVCHGMNHFAIICKKTPQDSGKSNLGNKTRNNSNYVKKKLDGAEQQLKSICT